MNNDYLSIKEVAVKVGISPQAIYQRLDKDLKIYFKIINNKKCLNKEVLNFLIKEPLKQVDKEIDNNFKDILKLLERQLEEKDKQITEKDRQIERLQQLLDQQQQLNLIDKKDRPLQIESKSHWWNRKKKSKEDV